MITRSFPALLGLALAFASPASAQTVQCQAPPTNVVATATSATTVTVTWTDNATSETGYVAELDDLATLSLIQSRTLPANATTAHFNAVAPARDAQIYVVGTPFPAICNVNPVGGTSLPQVPTGLSVTQTKFDTFQARWTSTTAVASGFKLERLDPLTGSWQLAANVPGRASRSVAIAPACGANNYRLRAVDGRSSSWYSPTAFYYRPC